MALTDKQKRFADKRRRRCLEDYHQPIAWPATASEIIVPTRVRMVSRFNMATRQYGDSRGSSSLGWRRNLFRGQDDGKSVLTASFS